MQILNREEIKFADEYTIQHEPISSLELMERAARACVLSIINKVDDSASIFVFCGKGNNGGDGFAIARMLLERSYNCTAILVNYSTEFSVDCKANFDRLKELKPEAIFEISSESDLGKIKFTTEDVIIDALLGTGLNKPLDGLLKDVVEFINKNFLKVISIDCPTGIFIDTTNSPDDSIIRSSTTLTFQYPKLTFLMAQNKWAVPQFEVLNIGLHPHLAHLIKAKQFYIGKNEIKQLITKRQKFTHKGNFGHALIIAGNQTMRGAVSISAKACLRSGAGLLTVHSVSKAIDALMCNLPEAMCSIDANSEFICELPDLKNYNAIAIGPGIGTEQETADVLKKLLNYTSCSLVIDADALNILSENKTWLSFLPPETILTPHPKEFDRLTEKHDSDIERYATAKHFALKHKVIVVLKGAYTSICMPDGSSYFNSSGNSGLAKGGSGDALTGIITGLLARGYTAPKAVLIGVYVHGYAADLATKKLSKESLLASDVIDKLGKAFLKLED
ncbi:MAG: NAD(P)H-hydrate dehydratase [Sphingobacteriaceae bacterium]|nr:NAD(P)H-hydrate dehydratase [Sphingobacteriaceae bacterium]